MFRVLVTDACYKHSIALARFIRKELPDVELTGHYVCGRNLAALYSCYASTVGPSPLATVLAAGCYDMVIPVGARSVLEVARRCPSLAVLPSLEALEFAFDKRRTGDLASRLGVPVPSTRYVASLDDLAQGGFPLPCVVKGAREDLDWKQVVYCQDAAQLRVAVERHLPAVERQGAGLLVQERIPGAGYGFFALMDRGKPIRIFMHRRLRESPPTGGPSTAARAYYDPHLKELGLRLLSELAWTGVAMVEFRRDDRTGEFVLLEINGKFWGSAELGLRAGVNFGADLIRLFRQEPLAYSETYDREQHFYWPLDGDLVTLWKTGSLLDGLRDYWRPHAATNLGQSRRADLFKLLRLVREIARG